MDRKSSFIMGFILVSFCAIVVLLIWSQLGNKPVESTTAKITSEAAAPTKISAPIEKLSSSPQPEATQIPQLTPYFTATVALSIVQSSPVSFVFPEWAGNAIDTYIKIFNVDFWSGATLFLTFTLTLLSVIIFIKYFKILSRPGFSGYLGIIGSTLIWIFISNPGLVNYLCPGPIGILSIISFVILLIWSIIEWFKDRSKPKIETILSSYSETTSIRIKPYCLFCGGRTSEVQEHVIESKYDSYNEKSYYNPDSTSPIFEKHKH